MFRSNVSPKGLPDDWRTSQLSDFCDIRAGGRLGLNKSHYETSGVEAFSAAGQDGFVSQMEGQAPSIILASTGSCGRSYLTDGPWTTLANTQVITPRLEIAEPRYLHALLDNPAYWSISGSAQPFIKPSDIKRAWVPLPPLNEQRRIAEVLRSVDEAIVEADLALAQLKMVRQSALDALLSHSPEQSGSSRDKFRLSELISIAHGFAFKSEYFTTNRDDPILLTPGNFSVEKTLYFGERTKHYSGPIPEGYVLENGSLVVVMTDLTQDMAILGNAVEIYAGAVVLHNQRIGRVSLLKGELITKSYARLLLNSSSVQAQIKATASGSTVRHTAPSRMLECEVQLPPLDEQAKIVEVAKSLDNIIIAEERRRSAVEVAGPLAHLRNLKVRVIRDLLSGDVRVRG